MITERVPLYFLYLNILMLFLMRVMCIFVYQFFFIQISFSAFTMLVG